MVWSGKGNEEYCNLSVGKATCVLRLYSQHIWICHKSAWAAEGVQKHQVVLGMQGLGSMSVLSPKRWWNSDHSLLSALSLLDRNWAGFGPSELHRQIYTCPGEGKGRESCLILIGLTLHASYSASSRPGARPWRIPCRQQVLLLSNYHNNFSFLYTRNLPL